MLVSVSIFTSLKGGGQRRLFGWMGSGGQHHIHLGERWLSVAHFSSMEMNRFC